MGDSEEHSKIVSVEEREVRVYFSPDDGMQEVTSTKFVDGDEVLDSDSDDSYDYEAEYEGCWDTEHLGGWEGGIGEYGDIDEYL